MAGLHLHHGTHIAQLELGEESIKDLQTLIKLLQLLVVQVAQEIADLDEDGAEGTEHL